MPPNLGQGANSALVDSLVLAEELARAPSVMAALVGYDKRRRPLARRVQKTAEMLQRLCGIQRVTALRVRDALLAGFARLPRLSEEAIRRPLAADVGAIRSASLLGDARTCWSCTTQEIAPKPNWPNSSASADPLSTGPSSGSDPTTRTGADIRTSLES